MPDTKKYYLSINSIVTEAVKQSDFVSNTRFTAGARLTLELTEANEFLKHTEAWDKFIKSDKRYAVIFDKLKDISDKELSIFIENKRLPKDWDLVLIDDTQYILNKRAAKILMNSAKQIHHNLKTYLNSFEVLKLVKLK